MPWVGTVSLAVLSMSTLVQAQEWTRFRGPDGSGVGDAQKIPSEFTVADYNWIVELPGVGHSSPVLWGDKLFLSVSDEAEQKRFVMCYDSKTGNELWRTPSKLEPHHQHRYNTFASATPAVDEKHLFLAWSSGEVSYVVAMDHSGKEIWETTFPNFTSDHGNASSPILVDDLVIVQAEHKDEQSSSILALEKLTGKEVWSYDRMNDPKGDAHKSAYSTPVVYEGKDGRKQLLIVNTTQGFVSLDPKTGEVNWQHNPGFKLRSVGSMAIWDGVMIATMGSGGVGGKESAAIKLDESLAAGKPVIAFELPTKAMPYVPTPVAYDGLFFLWSDAGILTCVDAANGDVLYQERLPEATYFSSPVVADGKVFCGSRDGRFVAVKASREFKVLGVSQLPSGVNASPAIANGKLFIRTDSHLISLGGS